MGRPDRGHSRAATAPAAADPFLRDRVWGVPFEDVWQAAVRLVSGGLRGWSLVRADDRDGVIEGAIRGFGGAVHALRVEVVLDADAQTVVRGEVTAVRPGIDWGRAARRLRRFLSALDDAVARAPRRRAALDDAVARAPRRGAVGRGA
jgi:hypothetical protein